MEIFLFIISLRVEDEKLKYFWEFVRNKWKKENNPEKVLWITKARKKIWIIIY